MRKITQYLLNLNHPKGASKARFFMSMGYTLETFYLLAEALRGVAARYPPVKMVNEVHGSMYVIDGKVDTPTRQQVGLRTVWVVESDKAPRLVTAYPNKATDDV